MGGYLSDGTFGGSPIKFSDVPAGAINTVLAIPGSSWAQIICLCGVLEAGVFTQSPDRDAGDIAPKWGPWVRYDDPEAKTFKLNVERQNGRAAMLGITGIILHELVGVDGLYPTGGLATSGGRSPVLFGIVFSHESNLVHVYTFLNVCIVTLVLCTEERSVFELWRRIPSPCLVLSIELAFAAQRIHARIIVVSNASKSLRCPQLDFGLVCRQLGTVDMALRRVFINAA